MPESKWFDIGDKVIYLENNGGDLEQGGVYTVKGIVMSPGKNTLPPKPVGIQLVENPQGWWYFRRFKKHGI